MGGHKTILGEEQSTINFAYASVVSINNIKKGEVLSKENIWVKRPGTGKIRAIDYPKLLGKTATVNIPKNYQLSWDDLYWRKKF